MKWFRKSATPYFLVWFPLFCPACFLPGYSVLWFLQWLSSESSTVMTGNSPSSGGTDTETFSVGLHNPGWWVMSRVRVKLDPFLSQSPTKWLKQTNKNKRQQRDFFPDWPFRDNAEPEKFRMSWGRRKAECRDTHHLDNHYHSVSIAGPRDVKRCGFWLGG